MEFTSLVALASVARVLVPAAARSLLAGERGYRNGKPDSVSGLIPMAGPNTVVQPGAGALNRSTRQIGSRGC